jgi:hypothetical protein
MKVSQIILHVNYMTCEERLRYIYIINKMILDFLRHFREIKYHLNDDQDLQQNEAI